MAIRTDELCTASPVGDWLFTRERIKTLTEPEFTALLDKLITEARNGGLSDGAVIRALEEAVEVLDEGLP